MRVYKNYPVTSEPECGFPDVFHDWLERVYEDAYEQTEADLTAYRQACDDDVPEWMDPQDMPDMIDMEPEEMAGFRQSGIRERVLGQLRSGLLVAGVDEPLVDVVVKIAQWRFDTDDFLARHWERDLDPVKDPPSSGELLVEVCREWKELAARNPRDKCMEAFERDQAGLEPMLDSQELADEGINRILAAVADSMNMVAVSLCATAEHASSRAMSQVPFELVNGVNPVAARALAAEGALALMRGEWRKMLLGAMTMYAPLCLVPFPTVLLIACVVAHTTSYRPRQTMEVC